MTRRAHWHNLASLLGVAQAPLLFASPNNAVSNNAGTVAAGTQLHTLSRGVHTLPFDCSELRIMVISFDNSAAAVTLAANAFTVQGVSLEKGDASQTVVSAFGGSQSKVINPGDNEAVSDAIVPSSFSLGVFAAGSKWWVREQRSVAAAGLKFPVGAIPYVNAGFPNNVGIMMDPVTYPAGGGSTLGGTGAFALGGGGWTSLPSPPKAFLMARPAGAAPGVWVHIGDSIPTGAGDTPSAGAASVLGLMSRACWTSDGGAGNIACLNMGSSGAVGSMWQGANAPLAKRLWAYCNRATDNFGTNRFQPTASSDASERTAALQNWADLRAAGITKIVRTKLLPRTTSTDAWATTGNQTPLNGSWNPAGTHEVYDFNAWLDTQLGVGNGPNTILQLNAPRADTVQANQNFLIWATGPETTDGIHPNTAVHTVLASGEVRPALLLYP